MFSDHKRAAAEARALQLALALAARIDWRFGRGPMVPGAFAQYLHVESAHMLVVPTTAGLDYAARQVESVIRDSRSDALIVSRPDGALPTFAFATWARTATGWTRPLALWVGSTTETWLVPPVGSTETLGFRLVQTLHCASAVPWTSTAGRQLGYDRAAAWMAKVG